MSKFTFDVFSSEGEAAIMLDGIDILHIIPLDRFDVDGSVLGGWRDNAADIDVIYKAITRAIGTLA